MAKELEQVKEAGLPSIAMEDVFKDAGAGLEEVTQDDMVIPFVRIAQKMSDQINKRHADYIPGLEEGDFYKVGTGKQWKGEDGFLFVPVHYQRKIVEWMPDRGGYVQEHHESILSETKRTEKNQDILPNGNEIVIHATWYALIVDSETGMFEEAVFDLSSTQFKKSRQLVTKLKSVQLTHPSGRGTFTPPIFYNVVRAKTVPENNDYGSWMGWSFSLEGYVPDALPNGGDIYTHAKKLNDRIRKGMVRAAEPEEAADAEIPF